MPNMRDVIDMIFDSWNDVSASTIFNCWSQCWILSENPIVKNSIDLSISTDLQILNSLIINSKCEEFDMNGIDYVNIDNVQIEAVTIDDTVELVTVLFDDEGPLIDKETSEGEQEIISLKKAYLSIENLRSFLGILDEWISEYIIS